MICELVGILKESTGRFIISRTISSYRAVVMSEEQRFELFKKKSLEEYLNPRKTK